MTTEFLFYLFLAGAFGGFMAGLLGVGGGVVFVPLITFYVQLHFPQSEYFTGIVMANSFVVILVIGVIGTYRQIKLGVFFPKLILYTGIPMILFSLLTSQFFVASGLYSKRMFSIVFITLLVFVLIRFLMEAFKQKRRGDAEEIDMNIPGKSCLLPGVLSGVIAALSGLGGGIIMIPYFTQVLKMPVKNATAISLSVITLSAIPLVIYYFFKDANLLGNTIAHTGFIIWELATPLMIGAALTVGLGIRTSKKTSPFLIFILLSLFVLLTIVKMLWDF